MTATREAIVAHFISMRDLSGNWGTSLDNRKWNVDEGTYINGIMVTVDGDYYMGYVLEVVERGTGVVSYVTIALFHGPHPQTGVQEHDSQWYPKDAGIFFERTVHQDEIALWGVRTVYGLWESYDDAKQASRRNHPTSKVRPTGTSD